MTSAIGFPPRTVYVVTDITQDMPGRVTLLTVADPDSFAVATGQTVTFSYVKGMTQVNDMRVIVGNFDPDAKTFDMYDIQGKPVDTSRFQAYTSGGEINIISFPATAYNPPGLMYNNQ